MTENPIGFQWNEIKTKGLKPLKRYGHTTHNIRNGKEMILIGSTKDSSLFYFIYQFNSKKWDRRPSLVDLSFHTSCLIKKPDNTFIIVYGGYSTNGGVSSDMYKIEILPNNTERWEKISSSERSISAGPRYGHCSVLSVDQEEIFIFGGANSSHSLKFDLFKYHVSENFWTKIESNSPSPRNYFSSVLIKKENKIIIGCGWNGKERVNDFWEYFVDSNTWNQLKCKNQENILGRGTHQMIAIENKNGEQSGILLGTGVYSYKLNLSNFKDEELTSFWFLDNTSKQWKMLTPKKKEIYYGYSMIQGLNSLYLFGGKRKLLKGIKAKKTFDRMEYRDNDSLISFKIPNQFFSLPDPDIGSVNNI